MQVPTLEPQQTGQTIRAPGGLPEANLQELYYQEKGIKQAGNQIMGLGEHFINKFEGARNAAYLSQLEYDGSQKLEELQMAADRSTDYQNAPQTFRDGVNKFRDEYAQSITDNMLREQWTTSFNKLALTKDFQVRRASYVRESDQNKAALDARIDGYANMAANAGNPAEVEALRTTVKNDIFRQATAGWIPLDQAVTKAKTFESRVQEVQVRKGLLNEDSAEQTFARLLDPTQFQGLDEKKRAELTTVAQTKADMYRRQRIHEDEHRDKMAEAALKKTQHNNEIAILGQMDQGGNNIDLQSLAKMGLDGKVSESGYKFLRETFLKQEEGRTDGDTLFNLTSKAKDGQDIAEDIKDAWHDNKLSRTDMKALMTHNDAMQKEDYQTSEQKVYEKRLREVLGAEGFNISLTKEERARVGRATMEYYQRVRGGKEKPKDVYKDLADRYQDTVPSPIQLPIPRFAPRKPESLDDVKLLGAELIDRRDDGAIDTPTYEREVEVLRMYMNFFSQPQRKTQEDTGSAGAAKVAPGKKVGGQ